MPVAPQVVCKPRITIELICQVVDNWGDVGIGWRLARELAREHNFRIRFWTDRPELVVAMTPGVRERAHGSCLSLHDLADFACDEVPSAVVLRMFDSQLPATATTDGRSADNPPLQVRFEYLSAESWVDECHGLASLKADGSKEWLYLPGFTRTSGGLIREAGYAALRAAFGPIQQIAFLRRFGAHPGPGRRISLFCYPQAPVATWLASLAGADEASVIYAARGTAPDAFAEFFDAPATAGETRRRGAVTVVFLPFLSQDDYDRLLLACDLNFVRGEDSWIRAHWARRPFIWQPYIQAGDMHLAKLDAFLDRLLAQACPVAAQAMRTFSHAWSGVGAVAPAWTSFLAALETLQPALQAFVDELESRPDCCRRLANFIRVRL